VDAAGRRGAKNAAVFRPIACSLALAGLRNQHLTPAAALQAGLTAARVVRCSAVQLDGTEPGMRARELDRSGRRDVAATLRRNGLTFTGIDLWIPESHFTSGQHVDRAVEAVVQACGLAGELGRLVEESGKPSVSIGLPEQNPRELVSVLVTAAMRAGVLLADHHRSLAESGAVLGIGFDPASEILAGRDVAVSAAKLAHVINDARLTDASARERMVVGHGKLDVPAYKAVLRTVTALSHVVVDTRDRSDPVEAAREAVNEWIAADGAGGV